MYSVSVGGGEVRILVAPTSDFLALAVHPQLLDRVAHDLAVRVVLGQVLEVDGLGELFDPVFG